MRSDYCSRGGAGIFAVDNRGSTALHCAARVVKGHKVVWMLIENGVDVLALNSSGRTALHIAAETYGRHKEVQLLIEKGAGWIYSSSDTDRVGCRYVHY